MKLIISTTLFKEKHIISELNNLRDFFFDGLELRLKEGHFDYDENREIEELKKSARKKKIAIFSLHAPSEIDIASVDEWERVRSVREVEKAIVVANRLGAGYVIVHPGEIKSDVDLQLRMLKRSLDEIVDFSEDWGIFLLIENTLPGKIGDKPKEVKSILNMFEKSSVGCCLDTSHLNLLGSKMSDGIELLSECIEEIHIGDNHGKRDDHILPYEGKIDWEDFLCGLTGIHFEGALCFELSPVIDYIPVLKRIEEIYKEWQGRLKNA